MANLKIDASQGDKPYLLDFGASQPAYTSEAMARGVVGHTAHMGTAGYASPEHYSSDPLDARSDMYSIGMLLFALLSGKDPEHVPSSNSAMPLHALDMPCESPDDKRVQYIEQVLAQQKNIPPELAKIVIKAIQVDPADRYQNAGEMLADLRREELLRAEVQSIVSQEGLSMLAENNKLFLCSAQVPAEAAKIATQTFMKVEVYARIGAQGINDLDFNELSGLRLMLQDYQTQEQVIENWFIQNKTALKRICRSQTQYKWDDEFNKSIKALGLSNQDIGRLIWYQKLGAMYGEIKKELEQYQINITGIETAGNEMGQVVKAAGLEFYSQTDEDDGKVSWGLRKAIDASAEVNQVLSAQGREAVWNILIDAAVPVAQISNEISIAKVRIENFLQRYKNFESIIAKWFTDNKSQLIGEYKKGSQGAKWDAVLQNPTDAEKMQWCGQVEKEYQKIKDAVSLEQGLVRKLEDLSLKFADCQEKLNQSTSSVEVEKQTQIFAILKQEQDKINIEAQNQLGSSSLYSTDLNDKFRDLQSIIKNQEDEIKIIEEQKEKIKEFKKSVLELKGKRKASYKKLRTVKTNIDYDAEVNNIANIKNDCQSLKDEYKIFVSNQPGGKLFPGLGDLLNA